MAAEQAINALWALECLNKLMDACDEFDEEEPKIKKRKVYVKSEDIENQLLKDIAWKNTYSDDSFCPLTMENFEELCEKASSKINRRTLIYPSLSLRMRLAITLRYLIAGDSYRQLASISHVSRRYLMNIVPEMLERLIDILDLDCSMLLNLQSDWVNIAKDFEMFWKFPHALGIIDIKRFRVRCYHSNKSLILLSVLDAHSRFQYIEITESEEDKPSNIYINSRLYKTLVKNALNLPLEMPLEGQTVQTPYFFVGNEIFSMDRFTLTSYNENSAITRSQKAFNYRINRVKLPVQMAFEIIFFRFKIIHRLNDIETDVAKLVIRTSCLLHNFLTQKLTMSLDCNEELTNLGVPYPITPLPMQMPGTYKNENRIRDNICKYCVNEGNIAEQWQNIIKNEF